MNPQTYKKSLENAPSQQAVKRVMAKYSQFKGQNNRAPSPDRAERHAIKYIRDNRLMPIAGTSSEAGRFVAEYQDELAPTIAEYHGRISELYKTVHALEDMQKRLPVRKQYAEQVVATQPALLEVPEPEPVPHWRW